MNEFSEQLRQARRTQQRTFIIFGTAATAVVLFVVALIGYVSGTTVLIKPEDASKTGTIKIVDGIAAIVSQVIYSVTGEISVLVSAEGFESQTVKMTSVDRGRIREVKLVELPGRLVAKTEPETTGSRWTIDGRRLAIAPSLRYTGPAGEYKLEVDNRHFEVAHRDIKLERGEVLEVSINLQPVKGQLDISSRPKAAVVRIDGKEIGTTPLTFPVPGGNHRIEILKSEFETLSDEIEITNTNRTVSRDYRPERVKAFLSFDVQPKGGDLIVNGRKRMLNKPLSLATNIPHTFRYSHQGYFSETKKITIRDSDRQQVQFRLKPETGNVQIRSQPSATVMINGTKAGQTPLSLKLPAKPQRITIKRDKYKQITKEVVPTHSQTTVIDVALQTERAARLAEAPGSYTSDTGITLNLYTPKTSFQMGAPRHEKGQRANEFVRNVVLERPFYASVHETTNAQFREFSKDHKSSNADNFPVTSITWLEAATFCNWLSKRDRLEPFYQLAGKRLKGINAKANGYRLLTEAEWEWLARKAGKPRQTTFTWGNKSVVPPKSGNIADEKARGNVRFFVPNYTDGFAELAPVGSFPAEASGVFDLTGNVSEWVHDAYSLQPPTNKGSEVDPLGSGAGATHVVKGSSWRSGTRTTLRAAYRDGVMNRRDDIGFRIGRYL
jgi:formylglycine-generating enzyme required for sulfatase activity